MVQRSGVRKPKPPKKREPIRLRLRALDHAHVMIRDADGTINFWARSLERLYGFTSAEAVGHISHELLKTEFPRPLQDINAELSDTGEWNGELAQRKRDGETIVVGSYWAVWRESKNKAMVAEVSNEINESERGYLASIVDSSDDAIVGKTLEGIITSWNRAAEKMFGYTADEICGKSVALLIPPDRVGEEDSILRRIKQGKRVDHFESVRRRKDGGEIIVSLTISPIYRRGHIIGASKVARDITQERAVQNRLVELQSELLHASRLSTLGELTASITHEVSQPLTSVLSNGYACANWLASQPPNIEEAREALADMVSGADRASEVVGRVRSLAKKAPLHKVSLNINETVQETIILMRKEAEQNHIRLRTQLSDEVPLVWADRIQIQQVILNLITNAVQAISALSDGPRDLLVSSAKEKSNGVLLAVCDSGIGLSPEKLEDVFDAFYTTKRDGMGLGLAVSRSIINAHGGRLWATPNEPRGAVFQFTLPTGREETS